ncbi:MAG: class I SAM-dependent methyltransferase [Actinomycetia bacterium]|nr:class I SAM-dependent methyltransferase [Actinomycetes bacterium]MCL2730662.1 class I SAM-dependent methyltransferase [Actinomycetes bacterium]
MSRNTGRGLSGMRDGVELTAYLVNESRARRPELAEDRLAGAWIPDGERGAVRELWDEYAAAVYSHDDLVVSLRGRVIADTLARALAADPDTVLVVCGAGFSSYPWLLPFAASVEVDLPDMVAAKRRRAAALVDGGATADREVHHVAADLAREDDRKQLTATVRELAGGRPVAYVAEGVVFYLPPAEAEAVVTLGAGFGTTAVTAVSYWPAAAAGSTVLAAQRDWFRRRAVPADASYLTHDRLAALLGPGLEDVGPEDLQRRYLGKVEVSEAELIPEYVAVSWAAGNGAAG